MKEDLARCLDFMERDGELRMDTKLFALRDVSAEDAITDPGEESVGDLLDSLEKDVALLSESHVFTCGETAEALAERGSVLISALRLAEPENILNGENRRTLLSAGYAVVTIPHGADGFGLQMGGSAEGTVWYDDIAAYLMR